MRLNTVLRVAGQVAFLLLFSLSALISTAQAQVSEPDRDHLLNGLRIIYLPQPGNGKVSLQLRIHSGAAFDPAGKSGVMALLGDSLFPEAEIKNFFEDELGGSLSVKTDYDSINITITGNSAEVARMLDAVQSALVDAPLTAELVERLRAERIAGLKSESSADLADWAVSERLLGEFPYGRPIGGWYDTLAHIDRVDLITAREKFLNPNNTTLIVGGTFDRARVAHLLRLHLGIWRKSDTIVPSTFRQPDPPDPRVLIVEKPSPGTEVRMAVRGLSRADADYPASLVLGELIGNRLNAGRFARLEAHVLPGLVVLGGHIDGDAAGAALKAMWDQALKPLVDAPPSPTELIAAKTKARAILNERQGTVPGAGGLWLDADTFGLGSPSRQLNAVDAVSAADVQRVAVRLFKDAPVARVAFGNPAALKTEVEQSGLTVQMPPPAPAAANPPTEPARKN